MKIHMNTQILGTYMRWIGYWGFKGELGIELIQKL